jgi:hypothetical protein
VTEAVQTAQSRHIRRVNAGTTERRRFGLAAVTGTLSDGVPRRVQGTDRLQCERGTFCQGILGLQRLTITGGFGGVKSIASPAAAIPPAAPPPAPVASTSWHHELTNTMRHDNG